ncbi:MAG TPA: hypothetical protein VMZ31_12970 [Phycisphaerae bacterium]|nr:hypothetical protein [Phycisphaerae bacterium]
MELSGADIRESLQSRRFSDLRGTVESIHFEAKKEPYRLEDARQKLELAKDVSAMINAQGGVIVIGLQTKRSPTHLGDEVIKVHPFPRSRMDSDVYYDVLHQWIYPAPAVDIQWYDSPDDPGKGLGAIWVDAEPHTLNPYLMVQAGVNDCGKLTELLFGYAVRTFACVRPMRVQEIHALIREGRFGRAREESDRRRHELVDNEQKKVSAQSRREQLRRRAEQLLDAAALASQPAYVLQATPLEPVEIPGLFTERDSEVVHLLRKPPRLRPHGFTVGTGGDPQIKEGEARCAVNAGRALGLWRDGTLIFVAGGDADFLCWATQEREGQDSLLINQLVLVESAYTFVLLAAQIFGLVSTGVSGSVFGLHIKNMPGTPPLRLGPGPLANHLGPHDACAAPKTDKWFEIQHDRMPLEPGKVAYLLVREVYRWFEIEDEYIPYVNVSGDTETINPDAIKSEDHR